MFQTYVVENIKTHFASNNFCFVNRVVYEIMWKNIVQRGMPQMTVWFTCIACWIPKAKNTLSEYVILFAFPLKKWLHERALMLLYA